MATDNKITAAVLVFFLDNPPLFLGGFLFIRLKGPTVWSIICTCKSPGSMVYKTWGSCSAPVLFPSTCRACSRVFLGSHLAHCGNPLSMSSDSGVHGMRRSLGLDWKHSPGILSKRPPAFGLEKEWPQGSEEELEDGPYGFGGDDWECPCQCHQPLGSGGVPSGSFGR